MTDDTSAPIPAASAHLSPDQLADLSEGLLEAPEVAAMQAHLESCAACRATHDALAAVPHLLASAGAAPIPDDVATRVGAALALAAQQRSAASAAEPRRTAGMAPVEPAAATVSSLSAARDRRSSAVRLRQAGAALVGVAAVLGGGFLFTQGIPGMSGEDSPSTLAEDAQASRDGGPADDTAEGTTGVEGFGAPPAASGANYSADTLVADVTRLLEQGVLTAPNTDPSLRSPTTDTPPETPADPVADSLAAAGCVAAVAAESGTRQLPLAVDVATYEGEPAVIVVLPLPRTSAAEAEIWVVGGDCLVGEGRSGLDVLSRVTLTDVPGLD